MIVAERDCDCFILVESHHMLFRCIATVELVKVDMLCLGVEVFGNVEESMVTDRWLNFRH